MLSTVHDVLSQAASGAVVTETRGVRWTALLLPAEISVPGYVVATVLMQNAQDRPRTGLLTLERGRLVPERQTIPFALNPGEAGMLRAPLYLPGSLSRGAYEIAVALQVRPPHEEGTRILNLAPSAAAAPRPSVKVVSQHELPPVNLFAYEWSGFLSLYLPPQTAADLTPFRMLQELPSRPSAAEPP